MMIMNAGALFRLAVTEERPLQIAGAINAYCARLAELAGFRAIYLSGAGVANASFGLPDLGLTTLDDVAEEVHRITGASELPLLVDADTGWGDPAMTVGTFCEAGAAGLHLEDQVESKRCGHRPGKVLVSPQEMCARINTAVAAKPYDEFVVMARTDACSVEGYEAAIERAKLYVEAGADMIFAEALSRIDDYQRFTQTLSVPVLANMTEFGQTPMFSLSDYRLAGVAMVLYPLTAFRMMNAAAFRAYRTVRGAGTQRTLLDEMQTRTELYESLDYEKYEHELDAVLTKRKS